MTTNAGLFLFLAAAAIGWFTFASIAVWVTTPSRERQARDRMALLKSLAENPGENAREVLAWLREEEDQKREQKELQDRRGWIVGGLVVVAVGAGLGVMGLAVGAGAAWSLSVMLFLVGAVLTGAGMMMGRRQPRTRQP
jgi:hypothetical protein